LSNKFVTTPKKRAKSRFLSGSGPGIVVPWAATQSWCKRTVLRPKQCGHSRWIC